MAAARGIRRATEVDALALENILDNIPHFVFWKDLESRYLGCNRAFARLAGFEHPRELVGLTDFDLPWKKEESEAYRRADREVMSSGVPQLMIEETQLQADGTSQTVVTSKVPLMSDGVVTGVLGMYHDITDRKRLETELIQAKTAAELSDRAKTDFLAAMSHEIRTPLTLILAPLEALLLRGTIAPPASDTLKTVFRNAQRLKHLTDDVLDFSKASEGFLTVRNEDVALGPSLRHVADDLQPAAVSRQLVLDTSGIDDVGTVRIDVSKVERIVTNLIGNAIKFTPAGKVSVWLKQLSDEQLELGVKDTGIGIEKAQQHLLFQRFSQVDSSSTRRFDGTGLGLALVKSFAELMGGTVGVESQRDVGSTFTVRLPLQRTVGGQPARPSRPTLVPKPADEPTLAPARKLDDEPYDNGKPRVLLCEDNTELRSLVRMLLADEFQVEVAKDGTEAWDMVQRLKPDVVVTDLMMPGIDGLELTRRIKGDDELKRISVMLLTARAGADASADGLDIGADDYVCKPFNPQELKARVRAATRLCRLHGDLLKAEQRSHENERLAGLGRVLAKLSHEINNPVSVVSANIDPLETYLQSFAAFAKAQRDGASSEQLAALWAEKDLDFVMDDFPDAITGMRHAARRIRDIQADLQRFLRTGEASKRSDVRLDLLARDTVTMWKRALPPGIRIEGALKPVPTIQAEALSLDRMVGNLIKNAAEALNGNGVILVETEVQGDQAVLSVSDDGPGVPMEARARIFEPFFTTKDVGVGTGLGLSVCREIARAHGGTLVLDTTVPRGARFVLSLPTGAYETEQPG